MVAAGLSKNGVGKLIFVTGTMNSFSYNQTLELYKEDIERLGKDLYFQQDGASCHTGKKSLNYIKNNFNNFQNSGQLTLLIYLLLKNYGQ